jgi:hypothetical protein
MLYMTGLCQTRADDRLSDFDLIADGESIGFCQIRRRPSHAPNILPEAASHFYFEVAPSTAAVVSASSCSGALLSRRAPWA